MNHSIVAALALSLAASGCAAAVQSYSLPLSGAEASGYFAPISACATQRSLQSVRHPDSINVRAVPGAWVQYMVQNGAFNMVVVVEDGSGGPEAIHQRIAAAKHRGDELFACAQAAGPQPISADAPATHARLPDAPAPPNEAPAPKPVSAKGGKDPFAGMMNAMGKGLGAMEACTKLTACRTRLSGELCLGADKACLDAINSGDSGGPDGCARNLDRVRAAADKYKRRIPGYELPNECK